MSDKQLKELLARDEEICWIMVNTPDLSEVEHDALLEEKAMLEMILMSGKGGARCD